MTKNEFNVIKDELQTIINNVKRLKNEKVIRDSEKFRDEVVEFALLKMRCLEVILDELVVY